MESPFEHDGRGTASAPEACQHQPNRPQCRNEFELAIVCALPLEFDAVSLIIDEFYDAYGDRYGRAVGDKNHYVTGRVGHHHVVLTLLASMGKVHAATSVARLGSSYPGLKLVLLVGICGGVPIIQNGTELLLGDVVISENVVQYDLGRQYPSGFMIKETARNSSGPFNPDIHGLLATLRTQLGLERLQQRTSYFLQEVQNKAIARHCDGRYDNPGSHKDKLFSREYRHKHHGQCACVCRQWARTTDPVCDLALKSSCDELGCSDIVPRRRLEMRMALERERDDVKLQEPLLFLGPIASGDIVMKSGVDRDKLFEELKVLAFEMEGSGIWDEIPCVIIKGVCDYADSHKNKDWQDFAAATAASTTRALLERYPRTDRHYNNSQSDAVGASRTSFGVPDPRLQPSAVLAPEQHWRNFLVSPALAHLPRSLHHHLATSVYSDSLCTDWKAAVSTFIINQAEVPIWLSNTSPYESWSTGLDRAICYQVASFGNESEEPQEGEYEDMLLALLGGMEEYEVKGEIQAESQPMKLNDGITSQRSAKHGRKRLKRRPNKLKRVYLFYVASDELQPTDDRHEFSPLQSFLWSLIAQILLWQFESMSIFLSWLGVLQPEVPSLGRIPDAHKLHVFFRSLLELTGTSIVVTLSHAERLPQQIHPEVLDIITNLYQGPSRLQVPVYLVMSIPEGISIPSIAGGIQMLSRHTEREECLSELKFDGQFLRRDEVSAADEGTNEWIWSHPAYLDWENKSCGILWIEGKAGSGKSVLGKTIQSKLSQVHRTRRRGVPLPPISDWFYSTRHGGTTRSHAAFLRSTLSQLLEQNNESFSEYASVYREKKQDNNTWSQGDYERVLERLASQGTSAICIVDAMDESEGGEQGSELRSHLISLIARLVQTPGSRMRFIVLSRYTVDIDQALHRSWKRGDHLSHILLERENQGDIAQIVDNGLAVLNRTIDSFDSDEELPQFSPKLRSMHDFDQRVLARTRAYLVNNAEGVILWVKLAIQVLIERVRNGLYTLRELEGGLRSLPKDLIDFYKLTLNDLITRFSPQELEKTRNCLMWVVGASAIRPIALDELYEAISIPPSSEPALLSDYDPISQSQLRIQARSWIGFYRQLRMRCGPFLEVIIPTKPDLTSGFRENTAIHPRFTVQLLHRTVKDFLQNPEVSGPLSFTEEEAEELVQRSLRIYITLVLPTTETKYYPLPARQYSHLQSTVRAMTEYLDNKDLLELALAVLPEEQLLPHLMMFENSVYPPLAQQRGGQTWAQSLQSISYHYLEHCCNTGLATAVVNLLCIASILLTNWPTSLRYGPLASAISDCSRRTMAETVQESARNAFAMVRAFAHHEMNLIWDCPGLGIQLREGSVVVPTIKDFRELTEGFQFSHGMKDKKKKKEQAGTRRRKKKE